MKFKLTAESALNLLFVFLPIPFLAEWLHWSPVIVFGSCCLAIIPIAGVMGKATEYLADRVGSGWGGLLNASFGNACELIIALSALRAGYVDMVRASITGSIIGNILLVLGLSMIAGGIKHQTQTFNRTAATTSATLLALAAISLTVPAVFHHAAHKGAHVNELRLALVISAVQFGVYILSLIFSLKTHKQLYVCVVDTEKEDAIGTSGWTVKRSIIVLAVSTVVVAILSEFLTHAVEDAAHTLGMTQLFIGTVLVAIVGNAAEHSTAVMMAMKNKMDLSMNIALGSGAQIALFVAPVIVFASFFLGHPMRLLFSEFELLSVVVSVIILGYVATDGECNWLEGVQLLAVYLILCSAFYFA
ncbi:MAG: calcium/proton exchanger [Candidatus Melainabacteria bacterium]|nr:MAG: calcium/proton exchanger [Candidatus Melainabacteria bacterium]